MSWYVLNKKHNLTVKNGRVVLDGEGEGRVDDEEEDLNNNYKK